MPSDLEGRAKVMQVCSFEMTTLRKSTSALYYSEVIGPFMFGKPKAEADALTAMKETLDKDVAKLAAFIKHNGGDYLTGAHFTLADSNAFCFVSTVVSNGIHNLDAYPEVKKWYDLVAAQPGWTRTLAEVEAFKVKMASGQ